MSGIMLFTQRDCVEWLANLIACNCSARLLREHRFNASLLRKRLCRLIYETENVELLAGKNIIESRRIYCEALKSKGLRELAAKQNQIQRLQDIHGANVHLHLLAVTLCVLAYK